MTAASLSPEDKGPRLILVEPEVYEQVLAVLDELGIKHKPFDEPSPACARHGEALTWEPGGVAMPTIAGRWRCDSCDRSFTAAADRHDERATCGHGWRFAVREGRCAACLVDAMLPPDAHSELTPPCGVCGTIDQHHGYDECVSPGGSEILTGEWPQAAVEELRRLARATRCPAERSFQDEQGTAAHECGLTEGHVGPHVCGACPSPWPSSASGPPAPRGAE